MDVFVAICYAVASGLIVASFLFLISRPRRRPRSVVVGCKDCDRLRLEVEQEKRFGLQLSVQLEEERKARVHLADTATRLAIQHAKKASNQK